MLQVRFLPGRCALLASIPTGGNNSGGHGRPGAARAPAASSESVRRADDTGTLDFTKMTTAPPPPPSPGVPRFRFEPAIEEAALLYANGQSLDAKKRLLDSLQAPLQAAAEERVWLMLLELHQVLGERPAFDARSVEFALKFLRSGPAWRAAPGGVETPVASQTGGGAFIALNGRLSAESASQMEKIRAIAEKNRVLRLDFAKLQGADGPGCRVLLNVLQGLRRSGVEVMFAGEGVVLGALAGANKPGAKEVDPSLWLLRLEIMQWQGRRKEFDEIALQYAMTYEVSPPSYEERSVAPASAPAASGAGLEGALVSPAELTGPADEFLGKIDNAAQTHERVTVDLSPTARVDFAAAGGLLHLSERLSAAGKVIEFRHPNALVGALLEVIGVATHAAIVARK